MYVIQVPNMNLDQIYISGQCPRWIKLRDGKYIVPYRDKAVKIEQKKERFLLNCNDEDFYNIWWHYFDMSYDYTRLNYEIIRQDYEEKGLLYIAAHRASGMHVIKQDLWEVMVLSMIESLCGNAEEYCYCIKELERVAGIKHTQAMREAGKVVWYEFPAPDRLLDKIKGLRYGKEIKPLVQDAVAGWIDFENIKDLPYKKAATELRNFEYLKVQTIKQICLLGCGNKYATPFTKKERLSDYTQKELGIDYDEFEEWFLEGPSKTNKGLVQLYLLYNKRNPPGGKTIWA